MHITSEAEVVMGSDVRRLITELRARAHVRLWADSLCAKLSAVLTRSPAGWRDFGRENERAAAANGEKHASEALKKVMDLFRT